MIGLVEDITRVCTLDFKATGDLVYLLGSAGSPTLGASEYLRVVHGLVAGLPPTIDLAVEKQVQQICRLGIERGLFRSAHDLAEGGLSVALAECCIAGELGVEVQLPSTSPAQHLFGEVASAVVVSVAPEHRAAVEDWFATSLPDNWLLLGRVVPAVFRVAVAGGPHFSLPVTELKSAWEQAIPRRMAHSTTSENPR
jgi:phosphoribosylformylglycinamidine synthase